MTTEIHAHKVLNLLREQPMSEQVLRDAVYKQFGQETQFRTCKCSGFDFDALFSFFIQREKIIQADGKWSVNAEQICGH